MNKVFRLIWNSSLGRLVVASEMARASQKATGSSGVIGGAALVPISCHIVRKAFRLLPLTLAMILTGGAAYAQTSVLAGSNILVTPDNATNPTAYTISTEDDVTFNNVSTNELIVSSTAILSALQVTGATTLTGGLVMSNSQITGLANATANDHAVNLGQLNAVSNAANAGWNISAGGGSSENVAPGDSVDFSGDSNINVSRTGTNLTFSLADEINVDRITAGSAAFGSDGLTITGGPSVTSAGIDAGGSTIINLGTGLIGEGSRDAVTGGQVFTYFVEEGLGGGIRYFRANSVLPDSSAEGLDSIAIGPEATTTEFGESAIAMGQGAKAGGENEGGEGAIAIGRGSEAQGNSTIALGDGAQVTGTQDNGFSAGANAIGSDSLASAGNAMALGSSSIASGVGSLAAGYEAEAAADNALAAGTGAYAGTERGIALGSGAGVGTEGTTARDRTDHIAVGTNAGTGVTGNQTTAIGYGAGQNVIGDNNLALGTEAGRGLVGDHNISIGAQANNGAGNRAQSIAIGDNSGAGTNSVALGSGAQAEGDETLALGKDASAGVNGVALGALAVAEGSNIALGRNSQALGVDASGRGYLTGEPVPVSVVSVGSSAPGGEFQRRIVNVADGSLRYDAVNVGQLQSSQRSITPLIGGGVVFNPDTGTFSTITIDDIEYSSVADAIRGAANGQIDSAALPADVVRYQGAGDNRRISNVGQGQADTDAVNVGQLNEAISDNGIRYFHANTTVDANRQNDGASGANSMAIGPAAVSGGASALAIGHIAVVDSGASSGIAIGHNVNAKAVNSTALGSNGTVAYGQGGVAIGQQAISQGQNSIVIGTDAQADPQSGGTVNNAIVMGTDAEATADNGMAIGENALAAADSAVAHGFGAEALAVDSQAFGTNATTSGVSSQARGTSANASGTNAQASGTNASASGTSAIASGTNAEGLAAHGIAMGTGAISGFEPLTTEEAARNRGSIAIGDRSVANDRNALALGVLTRAEAESAIAVGDRAVASANNALAVGVNSQANALNASTFGFNSRAEAQNASAFGQNAQASAIDSLAVGSGARATAVNSSAFGRGAEAVNARSVALGDGARTEAAVGTAGATIDRVAYTYTGTNPIATVSVGTLEGEKRTITNVAAGRVSDISTDAINGSQLFRTNESVTLLGNNLDTAGQSVANSLGGTSTYNADNHTVSANLSVRGNNYTNVQEAIQYAAQGWNVSANGASSQNIAPNGSVDFNNTDDNIAISRSGSNLTFNLADDIEVGNSITVGDTVINGDSVTSDSLTIGGTTLVVDGDNATYNGNELATQADGLSFAGNTGGNITKSLSDTTPLTISGELDAGDAATGANMRVSSDGNQLNLLMARNLADLDSITINNGGPVINGGGIDMNDTQIVGLADGTADDHAVNLGQLNDLADTPLTFGANQGPDSERRLGQRLDIVGEEDADGNSNIITTLTGEETLALALNDDLTIGNSITIGNTFIDGDSVTTNNVTVNEDLSVGGDTYLGDSFSVVNNEATYTGPITNDNSVVNKQYVDGIETHYYSVNDGDTPRGNYANDGATGLTSLAAGVDASASALRSTALGYSSNAAGIDSIAVGDSLASGRNTIAIGNGAQTDGANTEGVFEGAVAIGYNAKSDGFLATAVGSRAQAVGTGSIAIGDSATTANADAINAESIAIGASSQATGDQSVALGANVVASGNSSTAVGGDDIDKIANNTEQADQYTAITGGTIIPTQYISTTASGAGSSAFGVASVASGNFSSSIGMMSSATGAASVALGVNSNAEGQGALAIGAVSTASNSGSVAVGINSRSAGENAIAIGSGNTAATGANSTGTNSVAIGAGANASVANSVALGAGSIANGTTSTTAYQPLDADGNPIAVAAPTATSEVSVGSSGNERRITNVAAGALDTDAVNVSQLKAVNEVANTPLTFGANQGPDSERRLGQRLDIVGEEDSDGNSNIITTLIDEETLALALNDDLTIGNSITVGDTFMDGDSVTTNNLTVTGETRLGDNFVVNNDGNVTYEGAITDGNHIVNKDYVDGAGDDLIAQGMNFAGNDGQVIHKDLGEQLNVVGGMTDMTEGAASAENLRTVMNDDDELEIQLSRNLTDLESVESTTVNVTEELTVAGNTTINDAGTTTNNLTVTGETRLGDNFFVNNDGNVTYEGAITDGNHIVNKDYVDGAGNDLIAQGMNFAGNDGQVIHKDLGEQLNVVGGMTDMTEDAASAENLRTVMNDDGELEIQLSRNLTDLESVESTTVNVTEELTVAGNTTINDAGTTTNNLTVTGETRLGDNFFVNNDGNVTYEGAITDGNHITNKQYVDNSVGGLADTPLTFGADEGTDSERRLGDRLDIVGEADADGNRNIVTKLTSNSTLELALNDDLIIGNSISVGDGPVISGGGIDMNDNQITNLTAGEVSDDSQDAINGSQLYATNQWIANLQGDFVNIVGDSNNTYLTNNGRGIRYVRTNDAGLEVSDAFAQGLGSTALGYEASATADQALAMGYEAVAAHQGSVALGAGAQTSAAVGTASIEIAGQTYQFAGINPVATVSVGSVGAERTITNVAAGRISASSTDAVNGSQLHATNQAVGDLDNRVTTVEGDINNINNDLADLDSRAVKYDRNDDGSVDYTTITLEGEGGTTITNVAAGDITENSMDAVNGSQLWDVQNQITNIEQGGSKYFRANSNGPAASSQGTDSIAMGPSSVAEGERSVASGAGSRAEADGSVALGADSVADREGMNGKRERFSNEEVASTQGAVSVGSAGNERQITNVAGGTQDTDAVNVRQLDAVQRGAANYDRDENGNVDYGTITLRGEEGTTITNLAPGVNASDAVNVGQMNDLGRRFENEIINVHGRIDSVERNANAGSASAIAASTVPQAWMPGKSMIGVGAGTYSGESAVSVGVSRLSDNGRWVIQGKVTGDSQSNFGAGIGAGWHW